MVGEDKGKVNPVADDREHVDTVPRVTQVSCRPRFVAPDA